MAENNPYPGENNTGHVWDDNLRELRNPAPRWWMIAFWASVIWWVAYGILYPMWPTLSGYSKGIMDWTQMQEYSQGVEEVEAIRARYEEQIASLSAAEILSNPELLTYTKASARVLFGDKCAPCHGSGGQGNVGFPVLADDNWLYGGKIETIVESITSGRQGVMTAHAAILKPEEVDALAQYAVALSEGKDDPAGKALFMEKGCVACHGVDGKGMQMLGSANLADAIWRFQPGGLESAKYTILYGVNDASNPMTREAVMPKFQGQLSEDEIKKLAVLVHSLGGGQ